MTPEQEAALYRAERLAAEARATMQAHGIRNQEAWDGLQQACHAFARQIDKLEKKI
jgi:hypothetical protein